MAWVITVMLVALTVAMFLDDAAISSRPVRAAASVLTVSPLRTGIEFVDGSGLTVRPSGGVLYPGGLSVGQQFMVEYDAADPQVVRVAGRTAANAVVMVGIVALLTWLVAVPVLWWLRRPGVAAGRATRVVG